MPHGTILVMQTFWRGIKSFQFLGVACALIVLVLVLWHPVNSHNSLGVLSSQNEMDQWMSPTSTESSSYATAPATRSAMQAFSQSIQPYLSKRDSLVPMSVYEKDYDVYGPNVMIDALNSDKFCHAQAHNLGRVIYEHTQNLADSLAICQSKCTDGCIHGVLMGMFHTPVSLGDPTPQEITPTLSAQIADTCTNPDIIKYTGIGNCYHAIGHVLASLVDEDIPQAIGLCQSIFQKKYGIGAMYYCATGVYMQESIVSTDAPAALATQSLEPCASNLYPAACYRYNLRKLFHLPDQYKEASQFCMSLTGSQQAGCFHGLGFASYKIVYHNPLTLNQLCGSGSDVDKQLCIEGALGIISVSNRTFNSTVCNIYTAGSSSLCEAALTIQNFGMNRDFALYTQ
jgi:hypothetical protein